MSESEASSSSLFPSGSDTSRSSAEDEGDDGGSESASSSEGIDIDGSVGDTESSDSTNSEAENSCADESDSNSEIDATDCSTPDSGSEGQEAAEIPHHTALEPLHKCHTCTSISVFESHLIIYQFCLKYGLSTTAIQELLQLLELHLPGAKFPTSPYTLKKFFISLFPDLESSIHHYCSVCHRPIDASSTCSQASCIRTGGSKESFISVPLQAQLKRKLEGI